MPVEGGNRERICRISMCENKGFDSAEQEEGREVSGSLWVAAIYCALWDEL